MSPEERRNLEEEFINLKKLLDFYVGFRDNISSMNNQEVDDLTICLTGYQKLGIS